MNKLSAMLQRLTAGGVDFVLVGGYAAVAHGASLVTRDVDICCPFSKENLRRIERALQGVHPRHRMTPQKPRLQLTGDLRERLENLYLETDLCVLDCLSKVAGIGGYDEAIGQSIELGRHMAAFAC
jgi:hypothetical protein